jgi:hypothetical protein
MYWVDIDIDVTRRQLKQARLGFGYADVIGGYGEIPLEFSTVKVVVLLKGGGRTLPRNLRLLSENECRRKIEMTPGVQSRNDTPALRGRLRRH